ncbi:MAG: VOC family protein [Acidimicrobiia bacterium]|nr:VOC family protein [Acidimicrobiia bacterium]
MKLQPIVYTTNMERAVDWYGKVLAANPIYTSDIWTSFAVGDAALGIHHVEERAAASNVELSLIATSPLEEVHGRLVAAGIAIERGIQDEPFGRSLLLRDPDGSAVQVNEHHE